MCCISESFGSKNVFMTSGQPPKPVLPNSYGGSGYFRLSTSASITER